MPRLPRLPRRRAYWQRNLLTAAGTAAEFAAWFTIGFVALVVADTAPASNWGALLWLAVFTTVIGAGASAMNHRRKIIRALRSRTPERHRRNPSSNSQTHNQSKRGLNGRFRRG